MMDGEPPRQGHARFARNPRRLAIFRAQRFNAKSCRLRVRMELAARRAACGPSHLPVCDPADPINLSGLMVPLAQGHSGKPGGARLFKLANVIDGGEEGRRGLNADPRNAHQLFARA